MEVKLISKWYVSGMNNFGQPVVLTNETFSTKKEAIEAVESGDIKSVKGVAFVFTNVHEWKNVEEKEEPKTNEE